jgi:5,10-methylenetetrahydrofolate reductase
LGLNSKIANPAEPVVFYEVIPPRAGIEGELEDRIALVREVAGRIDAINIPEIREELRNGPRSKPLPERIEPRQFARAIATATGADSVVNRVTVHETPAEQRRWLCETHHNYGIGGLILVGGESQENDYPGPGVTQTASLAAEEGLPYLLGGITIPHRPQEEGRVRLKAKHGLRFFTTQVLLDSREIVRLIQSLEGLQARILLSFTPVSDPKDLAFLEWLGVEVPAQFARQVRGAPGPDAAVELSLALARSILKDVFTNLPSQAPPLGLQVERITKRNSAAARRMLAELGDFYRSLLCSRRTPTGVQAATHTTTGRIPSRRSRSKR